MRLRVAVASCFAMLVLCGSAYGARGLTTGVAGSAFTDGNAAVRDQWALRTLDAQAGIVRIPIAWRTFAPTAPAVPTNPSDPAYKFSLIDQAVKSASARGLDVLLTATTAPPWAEGPGRPATAPVGSWRPSIPAFAAFGQALARRYNGTYPDPAGGGPLPDVRYFQAWNEPNLDTYIAPQWSGGSNTGVEIYRGLLNAFHDAVKSVNAGSLIVAGGTGPYGDPPGGRRTRPLQFLRRLLCVKQTRGPGSPKLKRPKTKFRRAACPTPARFDILSHHPINTSGGPERSAIHPDDVSTPDLIHMGLVLRAAERFRTVSAGRHALWVTEFWWNTNPPNLVRSVSLGKQAKWIEQALYSFWKQGASVAINLQLRDDPYLPSSPLVTSQSGIYFLDGTPKPSLTAFAFPFVADRLSARTVRIWGKSPASGQMVIQRIGGRPLASFGIARGGVFSRLVRIRGAARLRAVVAGQTSLIWRLGRARVRK